MSTPIDIDLPDIPMRAERMESTESLLTKLDKDPQKIENERLLARVKVLEEQLNGITGSIAKQASQQAGSTPQMRSSATPSANQPPPALVTQMATPQATPPSPAPLAAPAATPAPVQAAPAPPALAPISPTSAPVQTATAPAPPPSSRTSFGLDLAKDTSLGALRAKWEQLRKKHKMLERLSPQVAIRETNGNVELHLVVGPYINATDAAKTCAALIAGGTPCDGGLYDGQSLPPG